MELSLPMIMVRSGVMHCRLMKNISFLNRSSHQVWLKSGPLYGLFHQFPFSHHHFSQYLVPDVARTVGACDGSSRESAAYSCSQPSNPPHRKWMQHKQLLCNLTRIRG